jgi:hypothetical protein
LQIIAPTGRFSIANGANFSTNAQFFNAGTLAVGATSTFSAGPSFLNFAGTTLSTGTYDLVGTLEFAGANIETNAANLTLSGTASRLLNSTTGGNGLALFAVNAPSGTFALSGDRNFTTAGAFTNDGTLSVGAGSSFVINGGLNNFSGKTTTLTGGSYEVGGTLEFAGANVATNAAAIALTSSTAKIVNSTTGTNGLANFDENAGNGTFSLSGGASFTTVGAFTNNGTLSVGSGSVFGIKGALANISPATGTLTGGTYDVSGTLQSAAANIATNAANIVLNGGSAQVLNATTGKSALANFSANAATGAFGLSGGQSFSTAGAFANAGTLSIGTGSTFQVGGAGSFKQTAGSITNDGTLVASGGVTLSGGSLLGDGTISGNIISSGVVTPGSSAVNTGILTDTGKYTQNAGGSLDIVIGGTTAGTTYDSLHTTTAVLGGTLKLSEATGFVPTVGSTFKILNFTSETGKFAAVTGSAINSTEAYTVTYQPTDVLLTVVSTSPSASSATISDSPTARIADSRDEEVRSPPVIRSDDVGLRLAAVLKDLNAAYAADGTRTAEGAARSALVSQATAKRISLPEPGKNRVR